MPNAILQSAQYGAEVSASIGILNFYSLLLEVAGDCSADWPELALALARQGALTRMAGLSQAYALVNRTVNTEKKRRLRARMRFRMMRAS